MSKRHLGTDPIQESRAELALGELRSQRRVLRSRWLWFGVLVVAIVVATAALLIRGGAGGPRAPRWHHRQ